MSCSIQSTLVERDQNLQNADFYFGSGFKGDTVTIFFDDNKFMLTVQSDFSVGINLSSSYNSSSGNITLMRNGLVEELKEIHSYDKILIRVHVSDLEIQNNFTIERGKFVLIDYHKSENKIVFSQSKSLFHWNDD